jgi:inorganic phosphate transporter, PiT family
MGAGARKGASAVKWGVTTKIFWAWIFTIPVSGVFGGVMYLFFKWIN